MSEDTGTADHRALSFGRVALAYDRSRPSYPDDAVAWLVGSTPANVIELGAGTGKLTTSLRSRGHLVTATDPSEPMLRRLLARLPGTPVVLARAEQIPAAARSADVVASAQAFHWFDHERALPEMARVLRPGGVLALAWNLRDERIPWVRRLGALIGTPEEMADPTEPLAASDLFGEVETARFRFWQPHTRGSLRDLVSSRSNIAVMSSAERDPLLAKVDELYDSCARGSNSMLLPYVTHCFRAVVLPQQPSTPEGRAARWEADTDALLIDFR